MPCGAMGCWRLVLTKQHNTIKLNWNTKNKQHILLCNCELHHGGLCLVMSCSASWRYAMILLFCARLCCVMLPRAMTCYDLVCCSMACDALVWHVMLCRAMNVCNTYVGACGGMLCVVMQFSAMPCSVLCCIVTSCFVMYCTVLWCIVLYCTRLYCKAK